MARFSCNKRQCVRFAYSAILILIKMDSPRNLADQASPASLTPFLCLFRSSYSCQSLQFFYAAPLRASQMSEPESSSRKNHYKYNHLLHLAGRTTDRPLAWIASRRSFLHQSPPRQLGSRSRVLRSQIKLSCNTFFSFSSIWLS